MKLSETQNPNVSLMEVEMTCGCCGEIVAGKKEEKTKNYDLLMIPEQNKSEGQERLTLRLFCF